jgi:superfamily I DNA/RNA helicase
MSSFLERLKTLEEKNKQELKVSDKYPWDMNQKRIFNFIIKEKGNLIINARAGCGKTTVLLECLNLIPKNISVCFVAFNKTIVEEIKSRVPENVDCMTMHSYGYSLLKKRYGQLKVKLDESKIDNLILQEMQRKELDSLLLRERLKKLINLSKCFNVTKIEEMCDIRDSYEIQLDDSQTSLAYCILLESNKHKDIIDYADMVYLPNIIPNMNFNTYDVVFLDECQDLNKSQIDMAKKMIKYRGRLIMAGDPYQAINAFAGSDYRSFERLKNIENTIELPLTISYRCSKNIIKKANEIVWDIFANSESKDGVVREGNIDEIKEGDWVLCRNSAPLIELYAELLKKGLSVSLHGVDYDKEILEMCYGSQEKTLSNFLMKLRNELEQVTNKDSDEYKEFKEKIDIIDYISQDCFTFDELKNKITKMFKKSNNSVVLSTVHKSKGFENNRVFILRPDLLPLDKGDKYWENVQEKNLEYVAYTRAINELVFIV